MPASRRLPENAFDAYIALGPGRSYTALAQMYGVARSTVSLTAMRERWQARIAGEDEAASIVVRERQVDSLVEVRTRHLEALREIQHRAIERLRAEPFTSTTQAATALIRAIETERLILGEATSRTEVDVGQIYRDECRRWLDIDETTSVSDDHDPSADM